MNAKAVAARSILRTRSAATRLRASLKRGRALATHVIAAGVPAADVAGVTNGLRSVAKRLHLAPVKVSRTRRTVEGKSRLRKVGHYTAAQVAVMVTEYKPRKASFIAAKHALAA